MRTLLSFVAVAALAVAALTTAKAAVNQAALTANAQMHHHRHHHWAPKKATYGKRMRANSSCEMSGSCRSRDS
jgi:hypothetical protein